MDHEQKYISAKDISEPEICAALADETIKFFCVDQDGVEWFKRIEATPAKANKSMDVTNFIKRAYKLIRGIS